MALSTSSLHALAKKGALARIAEMNIELSAIYQSFPELRQSARRSVKESGTAEPEKPLRRRRARISAAGRERIRQAQLKRWAAVRAKKR